MQAVYIAAHGGPEALIYGERPEPEPQAGEVKLKVQAAALNRLDLYTRAGGRGLRREFPPPLILGGDCAGEVVAVGPGVDSRQEATAWWSIPASAASSVRRVCPGGMTFALRPSLWAAPLTAATPSLSPFPR